MFIVTTMNSSQLACLLKIEQIIGFVADYDIITILFIERQTLDSKL